MKDTTKTYRVEAGQTPMFVARQSTDARVPVAGRFWDPRFSREEGMSAVRLHKPPLELASKDLLGQPLSAREKQVLRLIAIGESYAAAAIELGLTKKAVDKHVERIHRKIGARCVAHLVHYALANGEVNLLYGTVS